MRKIAHWLEQLSPSESLDIYRELAISHAWEGGKQGRQIAELITRADFRALCEFEVDYSEEGISAYAVKHIRQALAYFQKVEDLEIGFDKKERAFGVFLEAEALCKETNNIFEMRRRDQYSFVPRVSSVLHAASRKIARILGAVPSMGELDLHFGPGATRATRRKDASIRRKLAEKLQCSEGLFQYVPYILEELPHLVEIHSVQDRVDEDGIEWGRVPVEITKAKLSFVPKNAKTYRSICTEPGLNTLVQLGIGSVMAQRLAAFGIDIRDQSVNQDRAREGSLTGALATLDLSSASDTISRELVYDLLPLDWAALLDRVRSRNVVLPDGSELCQEKFSSMGNGFTFPLETLIFWSLAAACCRNDSDATAYGDDLIVPADAYDLLTEVLVAVGFKVNLSKSYATGPFRESCGKDYFSGTPVRPIYPRGWVSAQSLFVLHNFYVRDGDLMRADAVKQLIHPALQIFGPDGYGDGHLIGDHPKKRPAKYDVRGYSGYFFDTFVTRQSRDKIALKAGEYVVPLYTIYRRASGDEFLPSPGKERGRSMWNSLDMADLGFALGRRAEDFPDDGLVTIVDTVTGESYVVPFDTPRESVEKIIFNALYGHRAHGPRDTAPLNLPTPWSPTKDQSVDVKEIPLPGVTGYKKISVYTLGE
jgi:hypothetical protein